ncbi:hypothetical protein KEM48_010506 [Puccinia striiformis f. sp. tritici PST-130]|nr:hypothetical protein KEM48_010506 [Puccinia striiformis f. sp. tritici PST-130]
MQPSHKVIRGTGGTGTSTTGTPQLLMEKNLPFHHQDINGREISSVTLSWLGACELLLLGSGSCSRPDEVLEEPREELSQGRLRVDDMQDIAGGESVDPGRIQHCSSLHRMQTGDDFEKSSSWGFARGLNFELGTPARQLNPQARKKIVSWEHHPRPSDIGFGLATSRDSSIAGHATKDCKGTQPHRPEILVSEAVQPHDRPRILVGEAIQPHRPGSLLIPGLGELAKECPWSNHVNSIIVCGLTGKVVNDGDGLAVFPNGRVYSNDGLESRACKDGGKIVCPRTGQVFNIAEIRRVFIS